MAILTFGLILVCLYLGYKVLSLAKKIGEYKIDWFPPNPTNNICPLYSNRSI